MKQIERTKTITYDQKDIDWGKIGELGSEISDKYYEKYGMKGK